MTPKTLRPYQWKAVIDLARHASQGERSLGLVAPTGAGKTLILHTLLMKTRHLYTGVLVAAPTTATEAGFYQDVQISYDPKYTRGSSVIKYDMTKNLFTCPREQEGDKRAALGTLMSAAGSTIPFYLTTHQQLALWGAGVLPADCTGKLLVLDEAHHAGTDTESVKLNTGLGEFSRVMRERGGSVLYTTATPFRADGMDVFPEGTKQHIRSIAEHAASGFAPANFQPATVPLMHTVALTPAQFAGDDLSDIEDSTGTGYQEMVDRWVADGKPKAVFVVPTGKGKRASKWARRLIAALHAAWPSVRVVDGVGADTVTKERFLCALGREAEVATYAESTVDVFVACKRFDEGTDWPLCSHIYNYGIPSSFGLVLQRWGRTFRDKKRYADYPAEHRETASIVFFAPRVSEAVLDQYEAQHREHALLLACYLADWETGKAYRNQLRIRMEKAWSRCPSCGGGTEQEEAEEIAQNQVFEIDPLVQAEVVAKIARLEASLGHPPTCGEIQAYLDKVGASDEEQAAAHQIMLGQQSEGDQKAATDKLKGKLPQQFVKAELREAFLGVLSEYQDRTVSVLDGVVSWHTKITGTDAGDVSRKLAERLWDNKPDLTEEMIIEAAKKYKKRVGEYPGQSSGDATLDFGYPETWTSIIIALHRCSRGLQNKTTLAQLLQKHGLKLSRRGKPNLTKQIVVGAAESFYERTGNYPKHISGNATQDFGYPETWAAVESACQQMLRGLPEKTSLAQILQEFALKDNHMNRPVLTEMVILEAIKKYHVRTGMYPTQKSGDATLDFGYPERWSAVNSALHKGCRSMGTSSLADILHKHGFRQHKARQIKLTENAIVEAAIIHFNRTGKYPTSTSGDASMDFGHTETWAHVAGALYEGCRGFAAKITTLADLFQKHGFKINHMNHPMPTEAAILEAVKRYLTRTGHLPNRKSGDATPDFGYLEKWSSVENRIPKNMGTTLHQIMLKHGLK